MSVPSLEQLFAYKTKDEVLASALEVAQEVELPITAWQPLEPGREIIEICCAIISIYTQIGFKAAASKLLSYAEGDWLTLTASDDYDTERIDPTYGTATVVLTNGSLIGYPIDFQSVRFYNRITGKTYVNITPVEGFPENLLPGGTLSITVQAEEPGSVSNAGVNDITQFVTPLTGVTCTNTTACVGADEESDPALVLRSREGNARLSPNGPRDAYSYFAKSATRPDGTNVGVTRTRPYQPLITPLSVILYCASASGTIPGTASDVTTDIGIVQQALLNNVVPTGFTATAVAAIEKQILLTAQIYLRAGSTADQEQTKSLVLNQLLNYFATIPIGGTELISGTGGFIFLSALIDQGFNASDQIVQVSYTNISNDIELAINEVPILTSTIASFSVAFAAS